MYYTHHFAHQATLRRAHSWLVAVGVPAEKIEAGREGLPVLALSVDAGQFQAIEFLINAAERTDPTGWPSFWDEAATPHPTPVPHHSPTLETSPRHAAIGWHPIVDTDALAELRDLAEATDR